MRATPLISATWASAAVFLLMKLAVMPMANFPLSSLCLNPDSLGEKQKPHTLNVAATGSVFMCYRCSGRAHFLYAPFVRAFVSPSGTNLPPPAEMKTSNWKAAAGWDPGCSLAIQPVRKTNYYTSRQTQNATTLWTHKSPSKETNHFLLRAQSGLETPPRCAPQPPTEVPLLRGSTAAAGYLKQKWFIGNLCVTSNTLNTQMSEN